MNYPESIYSDFEIIETDIHGEKHYGLVKHCKVLGIKFKRHLKVRSNYFCGTYGCIDSHSGKKWHNKRSVLTSAIEYDNREQEWRFQDEVTK